MTFVLNSCSCVDLEMRNAVSRRWMFTLFGRDPPAITGPVRYGIWQLERAPSTGREHWQGFIVFDRAVTFKQCKQYVGSDQAHVQPARGTSEQCRAYCCKEETRCVEVPPIEVGSFPEDKGNRSDLDEVLEAIKSGSTWSQLMIAFPMQTARYMNWCKEAFALFHPVQTIPAPEELRIWQQEFLEWTLREDNDDHILWYVDERGGAGKSTVARTLIQSQKCDYYRGGKLTDMAYRCTCKPVQIIDLCRQKQDTFQYDFLEQLYDGLVQSDKYTCQLKTFPKRPKIAVFSNWEPDKEQLSKYKLKVIHLSYF